MTDRLRMDYINSLPSPIYLRIAGDTNLWPLDRIDVETGLLKFDVCGLLQNGHIGMLPSSLIPMAYITIQKPFTAIIRRIYE